jgi:hypothetical protein
MISCPETSVIKSRSAPGKSRNSADKMLVLGIDGMVLAFLLKYYIKISV